MRELAAKADVLVEGFRPGTLEEMGLAPAILHARNPGLIIVRISGFGQTGPYAPRPGFGTLVEAMSGFSARNGFADREPVLPPLALADMIAGLYGAFATVTAVTRARAWRGAWAGHRSVAAGTDHFDFGTGGRGVHDHARDQTAGG